MDIIVKLYEIGFFIFILFFSISKDYGKVTIKRFFMIVVFAYIWPAVIFWMAKHWFFIKYFGSDIK